MFLTAHIDTKWVDIVSPLAPVPTAEPVAMGVAVAALLVVAAIGVLLYRRPRYRVKRALRRLARRLEDSRLEPRPACFEVRAFLRAGFGRRRLRSIRWIDASDSDWQQYLDHLARLCFSAGTPAPAEVNGIIGEAVVWLDHRQVEG
jgi:hypothetical protein